MNILDDTCYNLKKRGYDVKKFTSGTEACEYLKNTVTGKKVGLGGSMTLKALNIYSILSENNSVFWHWC